MKPLEDWFTPVSVCTIGLLSSLMTASVFVGFTVSLSCTVTATIAPESSVAREIGSSGPA